MKGLLALFPALFLLLTSCSVPHRGLVETAPQPSTVIVLHGLFASPDHVEPLREGLAAQGIICLSPDLQPSNGSLPIEAMAEQLDSFLQKNVPSNAPLQFVGHSMGGLVALQYLQSATHAQRCRGLFTIATPHHGTFLANLHTGPAGRQMLPNSPFTQNLNSRTPRFPVVTYRTPNDLVIIPNSSSVLSFAENKVIASPGHNEIVSSPELIEDLGRRIRQHDSAAGVR
ncbi:alpha/beta fold hydrolase [Roseibacillus persicicus]|uniref:lipase family alpha/beta hydrolase n=1 Tax=Roseibacillus persicicus TaxID=454148 RepID=UPI00398B3960